MDLLTLQFIRVLSRALRQWESSLQTRGVLTERQVWGDPNPHLPPQKLPLPTASQVQACISPDLPSSLPCPDSIWPPAPAPAWPVAKAPVTWLWQALWVLSCHHPVSSADWGLDQGVSWGPLSISAGRSLGPGHMCSHTQHPCSRRFQGQCRPVRCWHPVMVKDMNSDIWGPLSSSWKLLDGCWNHSEHLPRASSSSPSWFYWLQLQKKQEDSRKTATSAALTELKPLTVDHN